jgi:two-component system, OmpR family, sensor kinase
MILNSIKWRLQLWYGLILVVVLAGFGITAFELERGRLMRRIDEQLQQRAGVIANALRPSPGQGRNREGRPPIEFEPILSGMDTDDIPPRRPPPVRPTPDDPGADFLGRPLPSPKDFHMPQLPGALFDESDTNGFYYVVWSRWSSEGKELARSANAPAEAGFSRGDGPSFRVRQQSVNSISADLSQFGPRRPQRNPAESLGNLREAAHFLPSGEMVIVGRSIEPELRELRMTALWLTAVGGAVLLIGLAGGWWIVTRAMRPVQDISTAATKIAAGDLSQRINVANTENELGQLAGVLNSTFSRLDAAFTQQQQFTSDVAHELRTPVTVMLTQAQTTLNRERNATEYRETIESCQRAAQRMRRLIESLMELTRLDAGQEKLKRMSFDLSRVAREGVELVRPLAEERGVRLHTDLRDTSCVGDSEHLAQVITNLLSNAVSYNKPDGEVRVTAQQQDGLAVLTVTDTGIGISAEDLPHVFDRFYRADKSRSSGHAGLGLAICKAIVEAHGGTIEVSSELNAGTTFTVRLPAA